MKNPWEQILSDLGKHKSMHKVPTYFNLLTFVQSAEEILEKLWKITFNPQQLDIIFLYC